MECMYGRLGSTHITGQEELHVVTSARMQISTLNDVYCSFLWFYNNQLCSIIILLFCIILYNEYYFAQYALYPGSWIDMHCCD